MQQQVTTTNGASAPVQRSAYANKNAELWKFAEALSRSELIPKHFQQKPANVFLALQIADRGDLDAFAVMSNLFVVHGTPAFSSKFLIALTNMRGPFKGPLRFKVAPKPLAVTCYATLRETGDDVAVTVTMAQAEAAGWTKNTKYREIPEQMLSYRAATFLVRLYCPEVAVMGARTVEEAEDIYASSDTAEPEYRDTNPLRAEIAAQAKTTSEAPQEAPRVGLDVGEAGGAAVDGSGGPVSAHAKAIDAFVALGVPAAVVDLEIAQVGTGATEYLRGLYRVVQAAGPRALITRLRSEKACDMLDDHLGADPQPATTSLFGDGAVADGRDEP